MSLANQVCTTVGSVSGQSTVDGNTFVLLSYSYSYSNLWRVRIYLTTPRSLSHPHQYLSLLLQDFGIVVAFCVAFITLLNVFTQFNTASAGETAVTLFKRGSKAPVASGAEDEEKAGSAGGDAVGEESAEDVKKAMNSTPEMTDVFTWQHLNYVVPIGHGETRQLLMDVSGYVAPGKLTALMGESGAGKVRLMDMNILFVTG